MLVLTHGAMSNFQEASSMALSPVRVFELGRVIGKRGVLISAWDAAIEASDIICQIFVLYHGLLQSA